MTIEVAIVEASLPSAGTTVDATSTGFGTPKFAIVIADRTTADGTQSSSALLGFGLMAVDPAPFNNLSTSIVSNNAQATSAEERSTYLFPVVLSGISGPVSQWSGAFITDGVRFTKTSASIDAHVRVIMFSGDGIEEVGALYGAALDTVTSPESVSGLGFQPNFIFGITGAMDTANTDVSDSCMCIGVAGMHQGTTLRQWSSSIGGQDGQSSTSDLLEHRAANTEGSILKPIEASSGSAYCDVVIDSFDADGFTYSWTGAQTEYVFFLPIKLSSPAGIHISDGTISASATGWTSDAANTEPVFGMMFGLDGVEAKNTVYSAVGALHLTFATQAQYYTTSFAMDPDNGGGSTWSRTLRQKGAWEVVSQDRTEWAGTFEFNASNEMELASLTNIPAGRNTHLWYFMLTDQINVRSGADVVSQIRSGADLVDSLYSGSDLVF